MYSKLLVVVCFLVICLFSVTSCEYEVIEFEKVDPTIPVSFSTDIMPIFNSNNCNVAGCHSVGFSILDLSAANAYNDLFAKNLIDKTVPASSKLYLKLSETGSTHAGRSTPTQQATILTWIEQGAKNN